MTAMATHSLLSMRIRRQRWRNPPSTCYAHISVAKWFVCLFSHSSSINLSLIIIIRTQVKSDFLDALSKAENQVRDYQSQFQTLNHNFQKLGTKYINIIN